MVNSGSMEETGVPGEKTVTNNLEKNQNYVFSIHLEDSLSVTVLFHM